MKRQFSYHDDPYADAAQKTDLPILGKDWTPQKPTKPVDEHPQAEAPEENNTKPGTQPQMQSDLRYTSEMKKEKAINKTQAEEKVQQIVERADNVLMKLTTVFPFDLFPNTITIDANKVTIIDKTFFASETVTSILLEEITDVVVESNFFLARLVVTFSHHPLHPEVYPIANLRKKEALRAQEIIQGLLVLRLAEGIDLSKLQPDEITKELGKIGKPHAAL